MKKPLISIENSTIEALNSEQGVRLVRDLLWAEAKRLRISRQHVVISADITVADGGIDASIDSPAGAFESILVPGKCHYQIKTGKSFKPWQPSEIILANVIWVPRAIPLVSQSSKMQRR